MTPEEMATFAEAVRTAVAEAVRDALETARPLPPKMLFTAEESAEITGLPKSFFEIGWSAGHLPSRKVGGKYRRATLEDLELTLEMSEVEPTSGPLLARWRAKKRQQAKRANAAAAA